MTRGGQVIKESGLEIATAVYKNVKMLETNENDGKNALM
jgi:hypothetical protein